MTSARPILFSLPMIRALLEGRKTQTRRIFKVTDPMGKKWPVTSPLESIIHLGDGIEPDDFHYQSTGGLSGPYPCPYGQPNDLLWVRESWAVDAPLDQVRAEHEDALRGLGHGPYYRADGVHENSGLRWRHARFMPRWASRLTLELTGVRVERVQDIGSGDIAAEGINCPIGYLDHDDKTEVAHQFWQELWESINGADSWADNPWVWALTFKLHRRNIDGFLKGKAA